jgi:hypothetical protein
MNNETEKEKEIRRVKAWGGKLASQSITLPITEYEQLVADKKRLDWLEASDEHHGFCHAGYGEYIYYAHQIKDYPSVRQVIDQAMKDKPNE